MNKDKITVALLYGGRGYESEVSLRGAENIRPILEKNYNVLPIFIDKNGRFLTEENEVFPFSGGFFCPKSGKNYECQCAFPLLHGDYGEDGIVQGALECARIPYVGSSARVGAICRDKVIVKAAAERLGIPTLPCILASRDKESVSEAEKRLGYPMFVKPTCLGSSIGASVARDREQLTEALKKAFCLCDRVMVERLLEPKRELECGYFGTKCKELFTNAGEILSGGQFYDYNRKYKDSLRVPVNPRAELDDGINRKIKEYARRLVEFLGIRGLSRIDFFLSGEDVYFNEINTMPGFTGGSLYPLMFLSEGISAEELICGLIEDCICFG
jgi:D-alanine-D-alanine ligase